MAADAERLAGVGGIGSGVSASILKAIGAEPRADPAAEIRYRDTAEPWPETWGRNRLSRR